MWQCGAVLVRKELVADRNEVGRVVGEAFDDGTGEPVEVKLVERLRLCRGWIPELSLVAVRDEQIVGHVVCSRGIVGSTAALGLGPIAVAPGVQRQGIGSALMHSVLGAAEARGEPLVALLGNPEFYSKFGFVASTEHGIAPPDPAWGSYFQVRTFDRFDSGIHGTFAYAAPFNNLD